jgi:hypothetical protein
LLFCAILNPFSFAETQTLKINICATRHPPAPVHDKILCGKTGISLPAFQAIMTSAEELKTGGPRSPMCQARFSGR